MQKPLELLDINRIKPLIGSSIIIFIMVGFLLPQTGHLYDNACWGMWSSQIYCNGLVSVYDAESTINYLPLYIYVLKVYSFICGSSHACYMSVYNLKLFTWLFDTASILLICAMIGSETKRIQYLLYGLLNIGFFYNTIIWGQVDGILSFFIFSAFLAGYSNKLNWSVVLYLFALNFKLQAIIFLPIFLFLWLPNLNFKSILKVTLIVILFQILIILPYLINGNAKNILKVAFGSVDYFKLVSLNAYNFWHILFKGNLMEMADSTRFYFLTYKQIGLILFAISSAIVLIPMLKKSIAYVLKGNTIEFNFKRYLLAFTLIGYCFFYFNTQMHERYIHSVLIFITALALLYGHWGLWLLVTLNYALTLEGIVNYLKLNNYSTLVFNHQFNALIYLIGLIWCFILWFKSFKVKKQTLGN